MKNDIFELRFNYWIRIASLLLVGVLGVATPAITTASPQMEMRRAEQFDAGKFAAAKPAVGEKAPELTLKTLDGETVKLADYLGKNVVLIKAGYT